ncbi:TDT family transporter [Photobacterium galatheae]|uniref:Tellurium resistance protein n=1 Tax=Photobacterium galatheae TaxID=1654360 RepID=A0A066S060_9GAMM|nr:TDT family transporter [Photobacterium galatheae]KDM93322.1 tellurium resistance protein [Photobacterium galatheae]MCM0150444.1 TDT family transporter [Photobacterium galatheae]
MTLGKAFTQVPTAQAALALAITGIGLAWSLYYPSYGLYIRSLCALIGACLLIPVVLKYLLNPKLFLTDLHHPLYGSLMPPMSMTMLVLADYLAGIHPASARILWYPALALHLTMMVIFFSCQLQKFRLIHLYPSWFLYPVGAISGTLAGSQLGYTEFSILMTNACVAIYFFMLPVVLYRLCFAGRLPRVARPTLTIMAAPVNLSLTAYLTNLDHPDPVLTGALAGIGITMTIFVYLCYIDILKYRFQPSLAAITFPSVISAVAMHRLIEWLPDEHALSKYLNMTGVIEISVATLLVLWVGANYAIYYWNSYLREPSNASH